MANRNSKAETVDTASIAQSKCYAVRGELAALLLNSGFMLVEEDSYANDYVCVCLAYHSPEELIIVDNIGDYRAMLPMCKYSLYGWFKAHPQFGNVRLPHAVERIKHC